MRILVFSDSHGTTHNMREAMQLHKNADAVIFLGDGERDFSYLTGMQEIKNTVCVSGNCDFYSQLNDNEIFTAGAVKIFCTHGHNEGVKYGTDTLINKALALGARIALYGHTHEPVTDYVDGLHIMNPGSIRSGDYGIIDITPAGIVCLNMKI